MSWIRINQFSLDTINCNEKKKFLVTIRKFDFNDLYCKNQHFEQLFSLYITIFFFIYYYYYILFSLIFKIFTKKIVTNYRISFLHKIYYTFATIYIYINILLPLMYYLYKHIAVDSVQNMWQIISQMCNEWSVKKLSKNFLIMINLKFKSNAEFDLWICVHEK